MRLLSELAVITGKIRMRMKVCVALCLALIVSPLIAEETARMTASQADAILKELQDIRTLLEKIEKRQGESGQAGKPGQSVQPGPSDQSGSLPKRKLAPKTASISTSAARKCVQKAYWYNRSVRTEEPNDDRCFLWPVFPKPSYGRFP